MPKIIELTVEIDVQRVSCPGVWLCQDGRVSLTVFTLGTSYQTCLLSPVFPLMFKDVFFFRKRFQETCALNNICCLLKDETIYCELVQWSEDCTTGQCTILAQYLGSLNEVLFPPNMCSSDGVDLLMRRSKDFPGILSPKIEIATKVRLDEVWSPPTGPNSGVKISSCHCTPRSDPETRQKQVCHSAQYHRKKCNSTRRTPSVPRSRSRSSGSRSCCSLFKEEFKDCACANPLKPRSARPRSPHEHQYNVYTVTTNNPETSWTDAVTRVHQPEEIIHQEKSPKIDVNNSQTSIEGKLNKIILESRYISERESHSPCRPARHLSLKKQKIHPCICEICRRYHELFHGQDQAV